MTTTTPPPSTPGGLTKSVVTLDRVVIRLAGDSGDGMQLTGNRFTSETASFGNDLSTLPNFPAEIRAPTGTLPGVSSFQLHFADHDIMTPGDAPDVLVVMNPAALKANIADLPGGSLLIIDCDEFSDRNLTKVGYATNPLEDGSLEGWQVVSVPLTSMTLDALADSGLGKKEAAAVEEHVHPRAAVVDVPPADRGHDPLPGADLPPQAGDRRGEHRRVPGRVQLRRDDRGVRGLLRDQAGPDGAGHVPQHLGEPGAVLRPHRGRAALRACRSSSARTRSRRRRTSCTSWPSTRRSASGRSRPRTRSPASARPSAPRSAVRSG